LDGAWSSYEGGKPKSDDGTLKVISEFSKRAGKVGVNVVYESRYIWWNESDKRNYQLTLIDKLINTPYYVLVKDADEIMQIQNGRDNLWIKRDMVEWSKTGNDVGLLDGYSYNSDENMQSVRLLPSHNKLHYYSEKYMILHDSEHGVVMDYNPPAKIDKRRCFKFSSIIIINKWNLRARERMFKKLKQYDDNDLTKSTECTFHV
jgi:hypothetical protein